MTIKRKVMLINLAASGVVSLLVATLMFAFQWFHAKAQTLKDLSAQAEIIAANSSGAVAFGDRKAADEVLAALSAKPEIIFAGIYLNDGEPFTHYGTVPQDLRPTLRSRYPARISGRKLELSREIVLQGKELGTLRLQFNFQKLQLDLMRPYALAALLAVAVSFLVAAVLSAYFQRLISAPISRLVAATKSVTQHKDYSLRVETVSRDELGALTEAFNEMLEQINTRNAALEEMHRQLIDSSHRAGMAEVASGVIHNIGNVLNSANVSATLVRDKLNESKIANVRRLAVLVQKHEENVAAFVSEDPIGRQLASYLERLADRLEQERLFYIKEVGLLGHNIEHIKEIVTRQQSYAACVGVTQRINLSALIEDALQLNASSFNRHELEVVREFDPEVPELVVEKHKALQIIVNLIQNAKRACDDSERPEKRLTLRLTSAEDRIRISVQDNGIGILPENLTRIFHHGFTTHPTGHGFGLHNAALLAKEMGGRLLAESQGLNRGSCFILELPKNRTEFRL